MHRRGFGKIHKSDPDVLAALHTFLINRLLIFNFFSFIMYIEKARNRFRTSYLDSTFIFLPLFSFRKGPELTGHQHRVFSAFLQSLWKKSAVGAAIGRPQILPQENLSPQGENSVISLGKIRKFPIFSGRAMPAPTYTKEKGSLAASNWAERRKMSHFSLQNTRFWSIV